MTRRSEGADPITIMVVDDDPDIRDALGMALDMVLADRAHEIVTASNGREALELLSTGSPSLVLLDLMMPIMSGAELLDVMRRDERHRRVPVIIVSAWGREAKAVPGAQGFLGKPFNWNDLEELMDKYLPSQSG